MNQRLSCIFLFLFSLVFQHQTFAAKSKTDSLEKVMRTSNVDTVKARLLNTLARQYINTSDYVKSFNYASQAIALVTACPIKNKNTQLLLANTFNTLGILYRVQGDYGKALEQHFQALKIREAQKDKAGMAASLNNIAGIYKNQDDYPKALETYTKSLKLFEELGDKRRIGISLNNIGNIYSDKNDLENAIEYYFKALEIKKEIGDPDDIAATMMNIANIYFYKELYPKALEIYSEAVKIMEETGNKEGMAIGYVNIGRLYSKLKKYDQAEIYNSKSLAIALEAGVKSPIADTYLSIYQVDSSVGDFKSAFYNYRMYRLYEDSLYNEANTKKSLKAEVNFEFEKRQQKEELEQAKQNAIAEEELKQQKLQRNYFIAGFVLIFLLTLFIFRGYRVKQRANEALAEKNSVIEEKNKDITDSINYAKKIQEAILPSKEIKYKLFPDAFVLFQPRDIVSGDFYWFAEKNGKKLIAAVDCTGHGVPGAFMSMIGNAFLNEIVNEKGITEAAEILSQLRHLVIQSLRQTGSEVQSQDGMDIALLVFDEKNSMVEYAGANNNLLHFSLKSDQWQLEEYVANKRPIGYYMGKSLPFTSHKVNLQKGDSLYIFSDGYADQFGGLKGKKFKYRQLKEKLHSMQGIPMRKQEEMLVEAFVNWKGALEQVDDILVIGIRV